VVVAGAAALVLAMTVGTQAASDRIIGEEDSPPPFLTGSVPFDITIPETTPEASITMPTGMASFPIVNSPAFVSSSVLLREPDQAISDVLTLAATRTGATAGTTIYSISVDFISDSEGGPVIDPPGGFVASVQETGAMQDVTDLLFAPLSERTGIVPTIGFLVQSDIPEPGTCHLPPYPSAHPCLARLDADEFTHDDPGAPTEPSPRFPAAVAQRAAGCQAVHQPTIRLIRLPIGRRLAAGGPRLHRFREARSEPSRGWPQA